MSVTYYIVHPNGREKITPVPQNDEEAIAAFKAHWTAGAGWRPRKDGKPRARSLAKEVRETILSEDLI